MEYSSHGNGPRSVMKGLCYKFDSSLPKYKTTFVRFQDNTELVYGPKAGHWAWA